jgi:hypothetical protein
MRLIATCLAVILSGSTVYAEPIETQKIITALSGDFNGDGVQDLAMIVETEPSDPMDMHFFLGRPERFYLQPVEVVRGQIDGEWNGYDRPGYENSDTEPSLSLLPNGSIRLDIPALPMGGERTNQTITLAYRDKQFVVAGFAFEHNDLLHENIDSKCEYNVLTGKGVSGKRNMTGEMVEKPVAVAGQTIAFRDWNFSTAVNACE